EENAAQRQRTRRTLEICGRIAQLPADAIPSRDNTRHPVAAPQQFLREIELALRERLAHARAAHPLAAAGLRGRRGDLEARLPARRLQEREITGAVLAETEVIADHEIFDAEPPDEDF